MSEQAPGSNSGSTPSADLTVAPNVIASTATVRTPLLEIKSNLWRTWALIAKQMTSAAGDARSRALAATGDDPDAGSSLAQALADEHEAAIVAICAAVFSVEALTRELGDIVIDEPTRIAWNGGTPCMACGQPTKGKLGMGRRLAQILQRSITDRATAKTLADTWDPLIELRGNAVHFDGQSQPIAPHPSGLTNTSQETATYSHEAARDSVVALMDTLIALRDSPTSKVRTWAGEYARLIGEVTER